MSEQIETWTGRLQWLLVSRHDMPSADIDDVVAECTAHCAAAGESPTEAFGTPEAYAATVAAERMPTDARARHDRDGFAPGEHLQAAAVHVGGLVLLTTPVIWSRTGAWLTVTPAGLAGVALLVLTFLIIGLARELFRAGRLIAGRWSVGAVAALVVATGTAFTELPKGQLTQVPSLTLAAVGIALAVAAATSDRPWQRLAAVVAGKPSPDRTRGRGHDVVGSGPGTTADADTPAGVAGRERWLHSLEGVLRGRHEFSAADAASAVADARAHLAQTGTPAEDEFGPAEHYALTVAEQRRPHRRWWRTDTTASAVTVLALATYLGLRIADGDRGAWFVLNAVVLSVAVADLGRRLFRRSGPRPAATTGDPHS